MNKGFKEHTNCKGHLNHLTSDAHDTPEEKERLVTILKNYYPDAFENEKELA